jgi:hypothetical protein
MGAKLDQVLEHLGAVSAVLTESKGVQPSNKLEHKLHPRVQQTAQQESSSVPRTLLALSLAEERSSTTFKKCGAMVSTPFLRHSIPSDKFAKKDKDNPTYPSRGSKCRASAAGNLRALQYANPSAETIKKVMSNVNKSSGMRMRAWGTGTGVGGKRMEKTSKGEWRPDNAKHTPPYSPPAGGTKGAAGSREPARARLAAAKPEHKKKAMAGERKRTGHRTAYARSRAGA